MIKRLGRPGGLLLLFAVLSLAAVLIGAFVCASSGVPAGSWIRNLAAWGVGAVAGIAIAWTMRPAFLTVAAWIAPAGLAASFFNPAQEGVHRWIDLGPVHANVAMLLLPAALVALAARAREDVGVWFAILISLGLLVLQPDVSQATVLAVAAVLIAVASGGRPAIRVGVIAPAIALGVMAWFRPDPLQPVAEVEGIVGLAFKLSPALALAAILSLIGVAATPAIMTRSGDPASRLAGWALGLCFLIWAVAPWLGAFPVPFAGIGMSPIVGAWLGVGLLAGLARSRPVGRIG